jgi:hypothetical protein
MQQRSRRRGIRSHILERYLALDLFACEYSLLRPLHKDPDIC